MTYSDKLKKQKQILEILLIVLVIVNIILAIGIRNKYLDNEYLVEELNKTQKEKAILLEKLSYYEDATGK